VTRASALWHYLAGHPLLALVLRRVATLVPLLLLVSLATFAILWFAEGDPVLIILGEKASNPALVEKTRREMGLDAPFAVQYGRWLWRIVGHGDFGRSYTRAEAVGDALRQRFPATLELTLAAMIVAVGIGISAGCLAGLRRHTAADYAASSLALVGISVPIFWMGLLMVYFGALKLGLFPLSGRLPTGVDPPRVLTGLMTLDALLAGQPRLALTALHHLALPAITLGISGAAIVTRMTRASMIEASCQDFVRTARAKGLGRSGVSWHIFRNALVPIVTIVGLQVGILMGGAVITESVFAYEGVGKYLVESILNRDTNAVQGAMVIIAAVFVLVNASVDILYAAVDPRLRAPAHE